MGNIKSIIKKSLLVLKKVGLGILDNKFLPINLMKHNGYHKTAILAVIGILLVLISFTPYEGDVSELLNSPLIPDKISQKEFDERNLSMWLNLAAYKKYNEKLTTKLKLPAPIYPRFRKILGNTYGNKIPKDSFSLLDLWKNGEDFVYLDQLFPPINLININRVLRKTIGSGIKIKTDDEILYEIELEDLDKEGMIKKLAELEKDFWTISSVVLIGEKEDQKYKIPVDYQVTGKRIEDTRVPHEIRVSYNVKQFIPDKIDKDKFEYELIRNLDDLDDRSYIRNFYKIDNKKEYYRLYDGFEEEELETKQKIKDIFDKAEFSHLTDFSKVFERPNFPSYPIKKAIVYKNEENILRFKPNSRIYVDDEEIPEFIKKAFILVEDDFFYVNIGGIDPPGLVKATINYILVGEEKGNASITEQMYEMYLGKQKKTMEDKFVQILFAIYYSYFTDNREEILNFYIQSIPGSFWGDHCYGIKSISQNYLGKSDLKDLTWKELAWMTRIALLPSVHGIEYARFILMKEEFENRGYDIFNEEDIDRFLLLRSNIDTIRFPGDKVRDASDMKSLIQRYRRSYDITTTRIDLALKDFKNGNNFLNPLITEEEYQQALKEDIKFVKPDFTNLYQVYTDQTRKDIDRIFGKWGWNAGFSVTVSLDEALQSLIDRELEYSTIVAPYFKYWSKDEAPDLGGGSIMVKTHNIKNPQEIENKILAIASKHPEESYFNWAVDGYRHFGSIYKWLVLMLYLDQEDRGTLFDQYYDIPREFIIYDEDEEAEENLMDKEELTKELEKHNENNLSIDQNDDEEAEDEQEDIDNEDEEENEDDRRDEQNLYNIESALGLLQDAILEEKRNRMIYRPDNWKKNPREDIFGYYTYRKEHNITNFIQSKNVTFVHLSWITGIEKIAEFLNKISGINPEDDELRRIYQPYLSTVLGTGESSSVAFAQAASVIANKGKLKPLTTIEKIVEFDNSEIDIKEEPIQVVSREAAEQAFFVGYINTFIGTARRFIKGGIGKTGTADTDVSFLAMTARDKKQFLEDQPENVLNNNLLYLVNVGVNSGKLPDGLWGGLNGAYNARDVFRTILGWNGYTGKREDYQFDISAEDITSNFSDNFEFENTQLNHWTGNYTFKVPIPQDKEIYIEKTISPSDLEDIKYTYERHAEISYMNEQFESIAEGVYSEINPNIIDMNTLEYTKQQIQHNNYVSPFEQYRYSWILDPNVQYNSITGDFTDKRTGKKLGNSLDFAYGGSGFGSSGSVDNDTQDENTDEDDSGESDDESDESDDESDDSDDDSDEDSDDDSDDDSDEDAVSHKDNITDEENSGETDS